MNEEAIISQWNIDEHGNPISVKTEQETQVSVGGNLVQLRGIPDEMEGVTIEDKSGNTFFRVENLDEVYDSDYAYYLMKNGNVQFNPSQNGKLLYFKYYSKGVTLLSVSRIYYKDSYDNVVKILEDLIRAGFDALKVLEIFGGAKEVIDRLERDLDNGRALATQLEDIIAEGTPLQQNLHADITEAKRWKDSLHKDVAEGKILQPQLHQDVIDGRETDANLTQTINSATELDDKIKTTGNASFIIEVDNWTTSDDSNWAYMYSLTTSLNSSDLVFKTQEITTKGFEDCLLYSVVKNAKRIDFYTDNKVRTKVIVNARQYGGTIQDFSVVNTDLIAEGASRKYLTPQEKVNVGIIPDIKQQTELNKSQLEESTKGLASHFNALNSFQNTMKSAFTIVDDDGALEVWTKLKPTLEKKGISATLAITIDSKNYLDIDYLSDEQLLYLQNNLGCEIAGHSWSHDNLRVLSNKELEKELRDSKLNLISRGFNVENFVAPFGSNDAENVRKIASKYYNLGVRVGGGIVTLPLKNQYVPRLGFGSFWDDNEVHDFNYYKAKIDEAVSKKTWLIFMTHVWHEDHTQEQIDLLEQIIDYIKTVDMDIINLRDGYRRFGNLIEIENQFQFTNSGDMIFKDTGSLVNVRELVKNGQPVRYYEQPSITNTSPFSDYPKKSISIMNFGSVIANGFPFKKAGQLIHFGTSDYSVAYQIWLPFVNQALIKEVEANPIYFRRCKSEIEWCEWTIINGTRKYITDIVSIGSIPSKSVVYKNITVPYVGVDECYNVVPQTTLPLEVIYSAQRVSNTTISISIFNCHTTTLTPSDTKFIVSITK